MIDTLINPADPPERQREKLLHIAEALMRRVERETDDGGLAYAQFQRAAMLEDQVRERTRDLERALDLLNDSNAKLAAANRAIEHARQNLANAIETVQEGFALFDADEVLVLCNSRFGMHMLDIREALRPGLTFDDYVERVSRSRYLALPDSETPEEWAVRRRRRHQDRHVIFNVRMIWDRWVQVSEHRTADGGTVILQTDVTDIIRMERQERGKLLDDQARVIRATLEHINQGVCIFDAGRRLVGWNQRLGALLAIPLPRLRLGASFEGLLQRFADEGEFVGGVTPDALAAWVAGAPGRAPLAFAVQRSGLYLDVFAQEMPDGGFVMSFTDATIEREAIDGLSRANETLEARVMERTLELEDALANAERANAARTRFVAAASHDLLQPLSAAKLFISSVDGVDARTDETLKKAQNALDSVEGILGALLDISKLESGRAAVSVVSVRLGDLLGQLADEFAPVAAAKGLRLSVRPSAATVASDPAYLRRILQNLIGNAVRYTARGRVLVGARRRRGLVRLEVWDTGPGIPEAEQDNIFKEFHRLNARASASEGMGLGLAIVERACALLGHPLGLRSEVGRGTCFMVQVPLADASPALADAARANVSRADPPAAAPGSRIGFLVENDGDLRRAMTLLLEKWGISVLDAASGEEALDLIDELGILPDFFLVDQQLGAGMTGIDFIAASRRRHGAVPARIVTANRSAEVQAACARAGVEVIYKPIDARDLGAFLEQVEGGR